MAKDDLIWVVYNHMPHGQVMAGHYKTYTLKKKMGADKTEDVTFTAREQVEGLRMSSYVALHRNGKLEKNKVLIYPDASELEGRPDAANIVHAWAEKQGVTRFFLPSDKRPQDSMQNMEDRIGRIESTVSNLVAAVEKMLPAKKVT